MDGILNSFSLRNIKVKIMTQFMNERINDVINEYQTAGYLSLDTMIRHLAIITENFGNL